MTTMTTMSDTVAAQLRALGSGFNLPQVHALYAPLLSRQPTEGVLCHLDCVYGPHERHRLDLYLPAAGAGGAPVLVFLHGGGFVRGDKAARDNVGWYFARQGVVTVVPNYRLAPAARWPAGPEDVARLVQWLHAEIAQHGGDPGCIVLAGESAGAAHVAAATLIGRFGLRAGRDFRAAALLSGPYDAVLEGRARAQLGIATPDPRNDAYIGPEPGDWAAASIIDQIDAAPFPLLLSFAQRDLLHMQVQAGQLFAALVRQHGFAPELRFIAEHNHFSQTAAINTGDESVSGLLADFIQRQR